MKQQRVLDPPRPAPTDRPTRKPRQDALNAELQARMAEADWLKSHYDEQLRAAFAQIASLQARIQAFGAVRDPDVPAGPAVRDAVERERLRQEVERLRAAETRYLDRIEELKTVDRDG